mmetsp:Transcript_9206/g.8598  ORF Transcript_9206/g.8598 Transcript_9206/m.8598 type:complete len:174 (+) Transcript_9206:361-882(+)
MKAWLPTYHFEGMTALVDAFLEDFLELEKEILDNKEEWLDLFLNTPDEADPYKLIPDARIDKNKNKVWKNPINKLLLLFVFKSEVVAKAIDGLINHALDPLFHYLPSHMIEIHATLEWFKKPTIIFYTKGSANPISKIMGAAKKALKQKSVVRISCGKQNYNIMKEKILQAAR